jgi:N-acetylglutamate synthase-like GNAT family acetyltransferase
MPARRAQRSAFSEKEFYLREFRGRTLVLACAGAALRDPAPLLAVLRSLARNRTGVVLISTRRSALVRVGAGELLPASTPRLEARVWRSLRDSPRVGLVAPGRRSLGAACGEVALRLRPFKVALIDREGGIAGPRGERLSFVHLSQLRRFVRGRKAAGSSRRRALLREVEAMLAGGVPAVNVCTLPGLAAELFTYAGSGTLFTRERYVEVRWLGLDDYEAAHDLFTCGVEEGFLAPRQRAEVDRVLACGFGAFVEGRHLAGIGALLEHPGTRWGEIASLYTVTRFLGEGVGGHLVAFALARARERGLRLVFGCTTSDRVGAFFARQGFRRVGLASLPSAKWRGYDAARRRHLRCYARATGRSGDSA